MTRTSRVIFFNSSIATHYRNLGFFSTAIEIYKLLKRMGQVK